MRIVFLDFDGVLNAIDDDALPLVAELWTAAWLEPSRVERLNRLVGTGGARVVISSSWRVHRTLPQLTALLVERGFTGDVFDVTPRLEVPGRAREIRAWLRSHADVGAYVILDDDHEFEGLEDRVVHTAAHVGLTETDVDRAVAILNRPRAARAQSDDR